jgi:cell wall-associated NlpC family hydrolase
VTAPLPERVGTAGVRSQVVSAALAQVGLPYRYGGSAPSHGFDCSGLVVYSYGKVGKHGLPRSAAALQDRAQPIRVADARPGDLLFFELAKNSKKASHVAIVVGDRKFVHAPSAGKRVEVVSFDHVYWGAQIRHAGRLL